MFDFGDLDISYGDRSAYPALGFNPAPGKVDTIATLANNFNAVSGHLGHAHDAMTKAGQAGGFWLGDAAENFHKQIGELPGYLDKATRSLGDAGKALDGWHTDLTSLQRTAADYERQAAAAKQAVDSAQANPDLGLANQHFDNQADLQNAQNKLNAASSALGGATKELDDIRGQAARLLKQHQDLVKQVEDALKHAKDIAPDEPGFFDRLGEALGKVVDGIKNLAKQTWQWVKDHADLIAKIGDVLSDIGTVLSMVAVVVGPIPIVGEVVAAAAIGVSAAALAAHGLAKAAGANVSWKTMAFDALGMIPGGGAGKGAIGAAKVLPKALKAGRSAAKFAEEGGKLSAGAKAVTKTLSRASAQNIGSKANLVNKGINGVNKVITKLPGVDRGISNLAVHSFDAPKLLGSGTKLAHTAESGSAIAVGTAVTVGQQAVVQGAKWEAEPYIEQGKEKAMDTFNGVLGRR